MPGLWGGPLPAGLRRRSLVIAPGSHHAYRPLDWQDAIVMVKHGEIELECAGQAARRFRGGDLLWFGGLGAGVIRNRGSVPAELIAVSKQPRSES